MQDTIRIEKWELIKLPFTSLRNEIGKFFLKTKEILLVKDLIGYVDLLSKGKRLSSLESINLINFSAFY